MPKTTPRSAAGHDLAQPDVLVIVRTQQRADWLRQLLAPGPWRLRPAYSLDQALDLMKEQAPCAVLIDRTQHIGPAGALRDWLEDVSAVLPVILMVREDDTDQDACLLGIGVFQTVRMMGLDSPTLVALLDSAIDWADRTGRRRPASHPAPLLLSWQADGQMLEVSTELAAALGWSVRELVGRRLEDIVTPATWPGISPWSGAGVLRLQLKRRDGTLWPVTMLRQPMHGADARVERMVGLFTDSVRQRRLDRWTQRRSLLVAQKQKAERANQAKSRFMAAISHDLRQPMHALGLFLEELRHRPDPVCTADVLSHMAQSLSAMESLLDSVLALSRLESGQMTPNLQPFELEPILNRLRFTYRSSARQKGLRFSVASTDRVVMSDPVLLERMLSNLLVNAMQHTHQGGVLLTCRQRGKHCRLQVWDTGIGIPPEEQDTVFREFYRIERDNDTRRGVGLGLAIVRSCATLLGLPIELRSEVGRGTCFTIDVPIAGAAETHPAPQASPPPPPPVMVSDVLPAYKLHALHRQVLVETDAEGWAWLGPLLEEWSCEVLRTSHACVQTMAACADMDEVEVAIVTASVHQMREAWWIMDVIRASTHPDLPLILITTDTSLQTAREARMKQVMLLNPPVSTERLHGALAQVGQPGGWAQLERS